MNRLTRRSLLGALAALPLAKPSLASQTFQSGALTMGTGQPGGAFTIFGPAWGRLITRMTGVEIVYRATGGSGSNLLLIEEGSAQLGLCSLPVAIQAHTGTGLWTDGIKLQQFRVLFPTFPSILQIVAPADGAATLDELAGKPIGAGPAGTCSPALLKKIFASQGVVPSHIEEGPYLQQITRLLRGELAACAFFGAPPVPAIKALAIGNRLRLIGFSEAQAQHAGEMIPGLTHMILKAGTFPGQTIGVGSIGTLDIAVGTAELPDDLAAAATLAGLKHRAQLAAIVPAAARPLPLSPIHQAGLPFHPGALKALRALNYATPQQT